MQGTSSQGRAGGRAGQRGGQRADQDVLRARLALVEALLDRLPSPERIARLSADAHRSATPLTDAAAS